MEFPVHARVRAAWRIEVDGVDLTAALDDRLISLTHTDNRALEADQVDIVLDDADGRLALPPRGAALRLWLGWEAGEPDSGLVDKGSFVVDEIEHTGAPDQLTIRARSADLRAGLGAQRTRSFDNVPLAVIVNDIAASHGLTATIAAPLASAMIEHLDQANESDANLLTRLAGLFDAIATVKSDRLIFMPAGAGVSASGEPLPVMTIRREDGDQHRFSMAERDSVTAVKALYHDHDLGRQGEVLWGKAEDDAERNQPPAPAATSAPAGEFKALGNKYPTREKALRAARKEWTRIQSVPALRERFGGVTAQYHDVVLKVDGEVSYGRADDEQRQRRAQKTAQSDAAAAAQREPRVALEPSAENMKTLRHTYATRESALRAARAEWRRLQRGMAEFSLTLARGRPDALPDMRVAVSGWKPDIDGTTWCIVKVTHTLGGSGYTTTLELEVKATERAG